MPEPPRIGEVFAGRYRVEALLGEGGMGAVFRAFDESVGDVVALKTLVAHGRSRSEEAVERFRREVRLARRITHPNVARIHDLGEHDGVHYLTMEYVRGRDLSQVLDEEGPLAPARAAALLRPVADALDAIHAAGVVHRDVKPANILVEEAGRIVLTDFGIARSDDRATALKTQGPIGTPLYMAPEQIGGRPVDARTDLYALGLVLYELLTGEVPFLAETALATAVARLQQAPPDPRQVVAVPDPLAELVLRCLARDPDGRPASAAEVGRALSSFTGGHTRPPIEMLKTAVASGAPPTKGQDTVSPGNRTLAVLPFRYRGPDEHDYLGEALTDELIDLLSTTRGLRVLASAATARYRDERDPRTLGRELAVDAMVDGTVQAAGNRVRVTARLCEVSTGAQLWSDRFEGTLEDVFELQDKLGRRVAESLRVGLSTAAHRGDAPVEAVESYLRARSKMRSRMANTSGLTGPDGVIALLEQCVDSAPFFTPALAAHAMATLRAWFVPGSGDWEQAARESVARALERGGELAETQLAAAMLAVQDGRYKEAARHLEKSLALAPTYAEAHDYLGRLQCEAGKAKEGIRRLQLALDLDPTLFLAYQDIARLHRLYGRIEESDEAQAKLEEAGTLEHPAVLSNRIRFACWDGDLDAAVVNHLPGEKAEQPTV